MKMAKSGGSQNRGSNCTLSCVKCNLDRSPIFGSYAYETIVNAAINRWMCLIHFNKEACGCRPMQLPNLPISSHISAKSSEKELVDSPKYYQEIGAEMIGNQLIIRVEKDKNKLSKRVAGEWDPPCDCAIPEIRRPSNNQGPKIVNAGDNNQILFRIRSRTLVGKDDPNYKPEAFAYQLAVAKKGKDLNDQHRTIMVHPSLADPSYSQEVNSDHITDGNQNIYLLRINKKSAPPGQRKRNIELELRTPKPPTPRPLSQRPPLIHKTENPKPIAPPPTQPNPPPVEIIKMVKKAGKTKKKNKKKKK